MTTILWSNTILSLIFIIYCPGKRFTFMCCCLLIPLLSAASQMVVADLSEPEKRADALSKLGLCFGVGMIAGSTLGGHLNMQFGWVLGVYVWWDCISRYGLSSLTDDGTGWGDLALEPNNEMYLKFYITVVWKSSSLKGEVRKFQKTKHYSSRNNEWDWY